MNYVVTFQKPGCPLTDRFIKGPRTPAYVKKWGYCFTKDKDEAWPFPSEKAAAHKARIIEKHMRWLPGVLEAKPLTGHAD